MIDINVEVIQPAPVQTATPMLELGSDLQPYPARPQHSQIAGSPHTVLAVVGSTCVMKIAEFRLGAAPVSRFYA
jgi:hypothetical protein